MDHQPLHIVTPTLHSLPLSQHTGKTIYLKMECHQPPQSFKIRGIGRLCQYYKDQGKKKFVASSGGNAGISVAYAGRLLNIPVTVFIPKTSKQVYVDAIKRQGAEVIVKGNVWDEAHQAALDYCQQDHAAYIPPFEHPLIWSGHSTIVDEIAENDIKPEAIVVAVGGGGLSSGIIEGLKRHGWNDVEVITAETEGAASFAKSVEAGKLITLDKVDTIATSLAAKRVCQQLFDYSQSHPVIPTQVTDKQALQACRHFAMDHYVLVEASCGAALATVYDKHPSLEKYQSVLVVICGGIGFGVEALEKWR